ncbi:ZP3 protein, partial [Polyodon spathula]|nr:ZP3 protein [Polyodon spathula]
MDSKAPDSSSSFTRPALNKLRFDITAFRFQGDSRILIYVTCTLRAVNADKPADASNKACSYQKQTNRWFSEDGSSAVCGCCDTGSCSVAPRFLPPSSGKYCLNTQPGRGPFIGLELSPSCTNPVAHMLDIEKIAGQDPRVHVEEITFGPLTVVHVARDRAVVLSKESLYHPPAACGSAGFPLQDRQGTIAAGEEAEEPVSQELHHLSQGSYCLGKGGREEFIREHEPGQSAT